MTTKHLWETDHPYYCNDGNYFASYDQAVETFECWADFLSEWDDSDLDMNAIFRWDWKEPIPDDYDHDDPDRPDRWDGTGYHRYAKLHVYFVGQRKARFHTIIVDVCRDDEPGIIKFLHPRFQNLLSMWEPFGGEDLL